MAERSVGASIARGVGRGTRWTGRKIRGEVVRRVGGAARARVIVIFGLVLALNGAAIATVGAIAPELRNAFHGTVIGPGKIGLLTSVSLLVGAIATIPVGLLVDRTKRIPLLAVSIVLWSIATLLGGVRGQLLEPASVAPDPRAPWSRPLAPRSRRSPATTSPPRSAARSTGTSSPVRSCGSAFGFIISGSIASAISWRATFVVLALPGFFLARELYRTVPEPLRGGQSHLEPGVEDLVEAAARARARQQHVTGSRRTGKRPSVTTWHSRLRSALARSRIRTSCCIPIRAS